MTIIFDSIIRKKVINVIYTLGKGVDELIVDISISSENFNTIEVYNSNILLHRFDDCLEYTISFEDLDINDKIDIYKTLSCFL